MAIIKSADHLAKLGGRFYHCGGDEYCDTNCASGRYVAGAGFVRLTDDGQLPKDAPLPRVQRWERAMREAELLATH